MATVRYGLLAVASIACGGGRAVTPAPSNTPDIPRGDDRCVAAAGVMRDWAMTVPDVVQSPEADRAYLAMATERCRTDRWSPTITACLADHGWITSVWECLETVLPPAGYARYDAENRAWLERYQVYPDD